MGNDQKLGFNQEKLEDHGIVYGAVPNGIYHGNQTWFDCWSVNQKYRIQWVEWGYHGDKNGACIGDGVMSGLKNYPNLLGIIIALISWDHIVVKYHTCSSESDGLPNN